MPPYSRPFPLPKIVWKPLKLSEIDSWKCLRMDVNIPEEPKFTMTDCTEEILAQPGQFDDNVQIDYTDDDEEYDSVLPEMKVTIDVTTLNRKPKLKAAIIQALDPEGKLGDSMSDELVVELINTFPELRQDYNRLFYDQDNCEQQEGEPTYFPSIMDVDDHDELLTIEALCGFRESDDQVAHKYRHLKQETIDIIYGNPKVRQLVCRMKPESITDELVASMVR